MVFLQCTKRVRCIFSTSLIKIESEVLPVENAPCETPSTAHHSEFSLETTNTMGTPCKTHEDDVMSPGPSNCSVPLQSDIGPPSLPSKFDEEISKKDLFQCQRLFQPFIDNNQLSAFDMCTNFYLSVKF